MKKIGIMTMHRVVNYGSFLQAYSLKKIIKSLGYDAEFIDYEYGTCILDKNSKDTLIYKIFSHINIFQYYKKKKIQREFAAKYKEFLLILGVNNDYNHSKNVDTLVIGSDEVFNCMQPYPVGYSKNLFGYGYENARVISYAGSFGHTTTEDLEQHKIAEEIGKMLSKFKSISVRDLNSMKIVKELTGREPYLHLDPVLVGDFSDEMNKYPISSNIKNYIIIYAYPGRLNKKEEKYIKELAKKKGKKIISLGTYQKIADEIVIANPFEVLNYFKNADFVITDTFHGTVFSIITNTNFCTIIRKSNQNKLGYLLKYFKLDERSVNCISDFEKLFNKKVIFDEANIILNEERKKSIDYLSNNI